MAPGPPPRHPSSATSASAAAGVHGLIATSGAVLDRFLANNLITMYPKRGSLRYTRRLFDQTSSATPLPGIPSSTYALHDRATYALLLFRLMLRSALSPTHLTFPPILKLCSSASDVLSASQAIHFCSIKIELVSDAIVSSTLLSV
ncbi:putative Pentatricopeptide repeat-containing protein [Cocos nucifera]|uniref:Putative Pentatricopeptide repeat-containing protein n=1 Tax=Cocos nucifera TaxID=13894 RepID=A0A8K0I1N0_COCNU|nr:putative Pentatricopeptide repeat-containing protein [Cocos nucifera]